MNEDSYVTTAAWTSSRVRDDVIDEVADQFERPATAGAAAFWDDVAVRRMVRETSLAPRHFERRAG